MPPNHAEKSLPDFVTKWKSSFDPSIGRIPIAFLFAGPPNSGQEEAAEEIIKTLLKKTSSPDLIKILPEKSSIKIETIRELIQRLSLKPLEGKYLIVLIHEAETLTDGAANALLKTLEEPPGFTLFILISSAPEKLPSTILSRCQRVFFQNTTTSVQEKLRMILPQWQEVISFLVDPRPNFSKASNLGEKIAKEGEDLSPLFELLKALWRDRTVYRETRDETFVLLPEILGPLQTKVAQKEADQIFQELDFILETERAIEGNVNKTLALERLFARLAN